MGLVDLRMQLEPNAKATKVPNEEFNKRPMAPERLEMTTSRSNMFDLANK